MTVQNQNVKNVYRGNGSTTVFPFTFAINESHPEYIHVYITNDGGKAVETEDFTLDRNEKKVTYPKPTSSAPKLSATQRLTIYRLLPYEQNLNLVNQGPFFSEDVETQLDDLEMQIQQLNENLVRCFQIGIEAQDFDMTMELEPGKVICVNSDGNGFEAREALMEVNGAWDGKGRQIKGVAEPTDNLDAATKNYVDTLTDNNFMKLQPDGTAWEGRNLPISNVAGPVSVTDAATKDYVDRILNGFVLAGDSRTVPFDTKEQMEASDIEIGQIAFTLGYHDIGDGGAGVYNIRKQLETDVVDDGSIIQIGPAENEIVAELITDGTVNVKQFGAYGDGTHDDTAIIQKALDLNKLKVFIQKGNYQLTDTIDIPANGTLYIERYAHIYCANNKDGITLVRGSLLDGYGLIESTYSDGKAVVKYKGTSPYGTVATAKNISIKRPVGIGAGIGMFWDTTDGALYFNVAEDVNIEGGEYGLYANYISKENGQWSHNNRFVGRIEGSCCTAYIETAGSYYDINGQAGKHPTLDACIVIDKNGGNVISTRISDVGLDARFNTQLVLDKNLQGGNVVLNSYNIKGLGNSAIIKGNILDPYVPYTSFHGNFNKVYNGNNILAYASERGVLSYTTDNLFAGFTSWHAAQAFIGIGNACYLSPGDPAQNSSIVFEVTVDTYLCGLGFAFDTHQYTSDEYEIYYNTSNGGDYTLLDSGACQALYFYKFTYVQHITKIYNLKFVFKTKPKSQVKTIKLMEIYAYDMASSGMLLQASGGEVFGDITFASNKLVLTDANGGKWRVKVGTDGTLSTTQM